MKSTNWQNPDFKLVRTEAKKSADGILHEAAWLQIKDWLGRDCIVYAERMLPSGEHLPGIVHCVGGGQTVQTADLLFWANQGYACASFDWQLGEIAGRAPEQTSQWPDPVVGQFDPQEIFEECLIPIAIQAAMATTSWLSEHTSIDADRIGMTGISWGGYLTWITAAYDKRLLAICPVYGCGIFDGKASRPYSEEVTQFWKEHWDPQALATRQSAPAAYLSGTNDFFGNLFAADQLLAKLPVDYRCTLLPNADHSLDAGAGALAAAWMAHHLKGADGLPRAPLLTDSFEIEADSSRPIASKEIWWSNSQTKPRFACWNQGIPDPSARVAFARVDYADGFSLCSPLRFKEGAANAQPLPSIWPKLTDGLGWRWELGSTQLHSNAVSIEALDSGERIRIRPSEKPIDHPVAFYLRQINDERWRPEHGETLRFGWEQTNPPKRISAFLITDQEGFAPEHAIDCPEVAGQYELNLPSGLDWSDVLDIRIHCHGPRETFRFGPLAKISDKQTQNLSS